MFVCVCVCVCGAGEGMLKECWCLMCFVPGSLFFRSILGKDSAIACVPKGMQYMNLTNEETRRSIYFLPHCALHD